MDKLQDSLVFVFLFYVDGEGNLCPIMSDYINN